MALKHLLPRKLRDFVRPTYQRACGYGMSFRQSLVNSPPWPKPSTWHQLRHSLDTVTDLGELYRIANREFGIFQFEAEIIPFLDYIRSSHPRTIGEIGILFGGNTFLFERALTEVRQLVAIDLKLTNVGKARFMARRGQRVRMLEGNSHSPDMVKSVARQLGQNRFDFLFIDGDHSYEGVLRDFITYYPLVRPGGLIAFHDISPDELARFGRRSPENTQDAGEVYLLWRRLRERFENCEFVKDWNQFGYGIGVMTKPDNSPLPADWVASLNDKETAKGLPL